MLLAAVAIRVLSMLGLADSIGELSESHECVHAEGYSACALRQDMRSFLAMVLSSLFCAAVQHVLSRQKEDFEEQSQAQEELSEEVQRALSGEGLPEAAEQWQPQRLEPRPPQRQQQRQGNLHRQWQQTRNDSIAGIGMFLF